MAYTAHEWSDGDVITAELLNALEKGVENEQVGPQGPKGDPGEKGADGAAGEKGDTGAAGADGLGVKSIALTTDSDGKVTAGTWTDTADSPHEITVSQASA